MIDMLVSRFLYVLCWRNKVVIVLIILSASMGMLMMLSYHGGSKHPSQVNAILESRNGGGHLPLEHHVISARTNDPFGGTHRTLPKNTESWSNERRDYHEPVKTKPPADQTLIYKDKQNRGNSRTQKNENKVGHVDLPNSKGNHNEPTLPKYKKKKPSTLDEVGNLGDEMKQYIKGVANTVNEQVKRVAENVPTSIPALKMKARHLAKDFRDKANDLSGMVKNLVIADTNNANIPNTSPRNYAQLDQRQNMVRKNHDKVLNRANHAKDEVPLKPTSKGTHRGHAKPLRKETKADSDSLKLLIGGSITDRSKMIQQKQVKVMKNQDWWVANKDKQPIESHIELVHVEPMLHRDDTKIFHDQQKLFTVGPGRSDRLHELKFKKLERLRKSLESLQRTNKLTANVDLLKSRLANYTKDIQNLRNSVKDQKPVQVKETQTSPVGFPPMNTRRTTTRPKKDNFNVSSMILALARQRKPATKFTPYHSKLSYRAKDSWPEMLAQWKETEEKYCDGHFVVVNSEFAVMKNVIVDRNFCHGRNGGEEIHEVINQPEDEEYYTYFPGFYQLACPVKPQYFFNNNNHLNQWLYSVSNVRDANLFSEMRNEFTIGIVRYEYANMYHTTTDFYNAFLLMEYFNKTQAETNILIVDGHPKGALDPVWDVLFNSSHRISAQSTRTKYSNLVWGILGYNSPMMDHYSPNVPLVEEFRTFFLSSYQIKDNRKVDCDKINILFIWRRDYIAHPRNPTGSISRKIQNEQELVLSLRQNFPSFSVKGIQIDLFDMDQQLKFITQTDVLIGMHGAGLTHAMFLPSHAGMIELLPTYWSAANEHFHAIARWRRLHYRQWVNADPQNEAPNHFTKIPPEVLNELVTDMVKVVCGLATDPPDTFVAQN